MLQVKIIFAQVDPVSTPVIGDMVCTAGSVIATANITLPETADVSQVRSQIETAYARGIENLNPDLTGIATSSFGRFIYMCVQNKKCAFE